MADAVRCRSRDLAVAVAAAAVVAAGARVAREGTIGTVEQRVFERVNGLSDRAFAPAWVVMQVGSLGGAVATGVAIAAAGHPRLGLRVAAAGAITWLGSKAVKPLVGRGRPLTLVDGARVLGRQSTGLGYPSGHAGVAIALAAAAAPRAPHVLRPVLWSVALGVGVTRVYVGAHLPLDVAGGIALGIATERGIRLLAGSTRNERHRAPR